MTDIENVDQFMTRVMGIVNQIKIIGETISDQKFVDKILRSIPKKYVMIVTAIMESKYFTTLWVEQFIRRLLTHETRLNMVEDSM